MSAEVVALKGDVTNKEAREQGIGFAMVYTADLGNGRQISIQTNLPTNADKDSFDEVFDLIGNAVLRQSRICDIPALEAAIVKDTARIEELEGLVSGLNAKGDKLAGNDRMARDNHNRDLARFRKEVIFKEQSLAAHRALLKPAK